MTHPEWPILICLFHYCYLLQLKTCSVLTKSAVIRAGHPDQIDFVQCGSLLCSPTGVHQHLLYFFQPSASQNALCVISSYSDDTGTFSDHQLNGVHRPVISTRCWATTRRCCMSNPC